MRGAEGIAARVHDPDRIAGLGDPAVGDVGGEDPGMAREDALRALSR